MRDDELRALARADALGDEDERAALLARLVRAGQLPRGELKLRAWLGDAAARAAWAGIGELEEPPTPDGVRAQVEAERGRQGLPAVYLRRAYGKAWAGGISPLGEQAGVRVALAAFRCAGARLPERELPRGWEESAELGEAWLAGERDLGARCDAIFEEHLGQQRGNLAAEIAQALVVAVGCVSSIGAAESAGGALLKLAELWGEELESRELQAALRRELPPPGTVEPPPG